MFGVWFAYEWINDIGIRHLVQAIGIVSGVVVELKNVGYKLQFIQ
jgi:hypothetical protein